MELDNYISGPAGIRTVYIIVHGNATLYYTITDHASTMLSTSLGSMVALMDEQGNLAENASYDPWGRICNATTWTYDNTQPLTLTFRGFTGHEMLPEFALINMNGRVYDPVLGRFLSPDNYVQNPENGQSYNRYSYCLNNPLKYTDPNGDFIGTAFTFLWDLGTTLFTKGGIDPWNTRTNRREAWQNFDPTGSWSKTNKAWKIDVGLFKTDPNRTIAGRSLQLLSRCTWELPQTIIGNLASHTRNVAGGVDNVDYYGGATLVNNDAPDEWWDAWGFTLGPYINSKNVVADPYTDELFRHEYGHTLQSRLVGPLYLTNVALPSLISSALDYELNLFSHNHDRSWFETQANRMSLRYFQNHVPNSLVFNPITDRGIPWDFDEYPTKYRPTWYWLFSPPFPLWLLF